MRVFVVEDHEEERSKSSFWSEFKDAGITPRLLEGFERTLVTILEEMDVRRHGTVEIVAGIKVTHTKEDGIWTTGYQEHLELQKGQVMLAGNGVSFWVYGPDGPTRRVGMASLERLFKVYQDLLQRVKPDSEHLSNEMGRTIHLALTDGLEYKLAKIAGQVTALEREKLSLLSEYEVLFGFIAK